jgi:hypothetical protein
MSNRSGVAELRHQIVIAVTMRARFRYRDRVG